MQSQIAHYENKLAFEMDPSDLFEALNKGENIIIIDARKSPAFERQRIPGAINLPHREMSVKTTLQFDKKKTYVTYCDGIGCNASTKGALNMAKLGFKVKELIGGLEWWIKDGYATEGSDPTIGEKITCNC